MVVSKPTAGAGREKTMRCRLGRLRLDRLRLLGRLPRQVRQGEDFMQSAYAILKVPPERYAQLPASLLQANKGVAATPAQLAPRAGADLPLLRPLPNVALREIVVQRNLRALQDQQQIVALLVKAWALPGKPADAGSTSTRHRGRYQSPLVPAGSAEPVCGSTARRAANTRRGANPKP